MQAMSDSLRQMLGTFLYLQGTLVIALLGVGWCWAGTMRRRERLRRLHRSYADARAGAGGPHIDAAEVAGADAAKDTTHGHAGPAAGRTKRQPPVNGSGQQPKGRNSNGQQAHGQEQQRSRVSLPGVTVVMPVKGCRSHSVSNWTSQVSMQYGGPLTFLFVVESEEDGAWPHLQQLQADHLDKAVHVVVAGLAQHCSQKIYNQLAGVAAVPRGHSYVLFLDDDVELHPGALSELVGVMEADSSLFMATGYPFDVPPPGASLATYCTLVYHTPLLIAFSIKQRTSFVWGGCMMLRATALASHDPHGLLAAWGQGGYSDDLVLASLVTEQQLAIAVPSFAIFPQWLDKRCSWRQYWNYLRRQLYVLDTYTNHHNRLINHTMMVVHSWASLAFALPVLMVCLQHGVPALQAAGRHLLHALLCTRAPPHTGTVATGHWHVHTCAQLAASAAASAGVRGTPWSAWLFLATWLLAHVALYWMFGEVVALLHVLDPRRSRVRLNLSTFSWPKLWAALLLENMIVPVAMAITACRETVEWGGVVYAKRGGRVKVVAR